MGGNAMKHVGVERLPAKEYFEIVEDVLKLAPRFADRYAAIPAYAEKESFGDLDFLIVVSPHVSDLRETLKEIFQPTDIKQNGSVWSFDYKKFQIDIMCSSDRLFETTLHYYSYNDVSNLVGRVAHKMGLKYGHRGLFLPVRANNTHIVGDVELSIDTREIFTFLGYYYEQFAEGFKTLEDIFAYIVSSPFFDKTAFDEKNFNHINRLRNHKRPTFMKFVKWLMRRENASIRSYTYDEDKSVYIQSALDYFEHNNSKGQLNALLEVQKRREAVSKRFSGKTIFEVTGLLGRALGEFKAKFVKQWASCYAMEEWVLTTPESEIRQAIADFYEKNRADL